MKIRSIGLRNFSSISPILNNSNKIPLHLQKPTKKLLGEKRKQNEILRNERNKLAKQSLKDIVSIFSPNASNDEEDEELDLKNYDPLPIIENPPSFLNLSYNKQVFIINFIDDTFKKNWKILNKDFKKFNYWLSYGSYGPREGFPDFYKDYLYEVNSKERSIPKKEVIEDNELTNLIKKQQQEQQQQQRIKNIKIQKPDINAPIDLPFKLPPIISNTKPNSTTIVTKLPDLDPRSFGELRIEQYKKDRKMNPYNKFILIFLVILSILNFKRDRKINLTNIAPEYDWNNEKTENKITNEKELLSEKLLASIQSSAEKTNNNNGRKWYYLYLK
ncbi:hypothetical protein B5S31_g5037 [[Candida] boidinii]|nr:hypothetical protein B5S31_g5037 [[Candida] boidinii]GME86620.1 unnamed protein product [[Candida] boidinii]